MVIRVLYVDDESDLLDLAKIFLEQSTDFHVDLHTSATGALAKPDIGSYDAIISDYQMPGMDGIAFLKGIRNSYGSMPFILFTGRGREEIVIEAINNGADFYLQKGGDVKAQFAELAHKVRQAVLRRKAEVDLIESEKRLSDIIDFLPDATFAVDKEGVIIAWNHAIEEMTGLPAATMLGKGNYEYAIPFYGSRRPILIDLVIRPDMATAGLYRHIQQEGTAITAETDLPHPKGTPITALAKASPLYNRQGEITGAIESIRDITARKKAEEDLQKSEMRVRAVLESVPEGIVAADAETRRFVYVNESICRMLGYTREEFIGLTLADIHPPEDLERIAAQFGQALEKRSTGIPDLTVRRKDGSTFSAELHNGFLELDGRPCLLGVFTDITERKKSQDELNAAYEQITASEEELREQLDSLAAGEQRIRENAGRLEFMLGFYERSNAEEKDLMDYAVEGAGIVTGSPLGYLAFLHDDESELAMYAWSKSVMAECALTDTPHVYKTEKTGLWGEAVRQRKPVITNDYSAPNPKKRGYPEGHPRIIRHMNIPVIDNGHVVIVAGVANKSTDYTEEDVRQLTILMQGLWQVVKQRRMQEALRQSEKKYREFFENSVVGIFRTTPDGHFSAINTTFARIAGYGSADEMMNAIADIRTQLYVDPADRDRFIHGLAKDGYLKNFQAQYYNREGLPLWILINAMAIRDAAGTILYYEGTIEDITEQKKAEEALHREKTFSDAVLDSIPGLLYLYDSDGNLVRWNRAHETITGYSPAELAGMNVLDWYKGDNEAIRVISEGVQKALGSGQASAEASLRIKDGRKIPFFFTARRLEIDGKTYFTGVGIDITERKKAEDELRAAYEQIAANEEELKEQVEALARNQSALEASEQKFRDIVESSPDFIWEIDTNGIFTYVSPRSTELLGYSPEELTGRSCYEILPEGDREKTRSFIGEAVRSGSTPPNNNLIHHHRDGRIVVMNIHAVAMRGGDGRITGFRGASRDVTDQKKAGDDLRAAYEQITANEEELRDQLDVLAESEKRIRESEEKYRSILDNIQDVYYRADPAGKMVMASPSILPVLGYDTLDEVIGLDLARDLWMYPERRGPFLEEIARNGAVRNYEIVVRRKDNSPVTISTNSHFYYDKDGRVAGVEGTFRDVSAFRAVSEQARLLSTLIEISPTSVSVHDPEGKILYANERTFDLHGYTRDEFMALNIRDLDVPSDAELFGRRVEDLKKTGEISFDVEHFRKDRSRILLHINARMTRWNDRDVIISVATDLSERVVAEKSLFESEERLQLALAGGDLGTWNWNVVTSEVTFNDRWAQMLGYRPDEIDPHLSSWERLVHPDDLPWVREILQAHLDGKTESYEAEYRLLHRSGSWVWVLDKGRVIERDDAGNPLLAAGTHLDITQRKKSEDAVRESERQYRSVIENIQEGFFRTNREGRIVMASPSTARMHGYSNAGDLLGHRFINLLSTPDIHEQMMERMQKDGKITDLVVELRRRDGTTFWGSVNAHYLYDAGGRPNGTEGAIRDVSDSRAMEQAVREANRKLSLLNTITRHDVANQLTALQGYIQIASLIKTDPVVREYLAKIAGVADTISRQIEFTRTYQELGVTEPSWFRIETVVGSADSRIPVKFSGTCRGVEIFADHMLERVFHNLFDNASRHGGNITEITVRCEREPDGVIVIIEDDGVGIPAQEKEKIFGRGYGRHTGLGLFLAKEILGITGIRIRETGVPGNGARFEILVPRNAVRIVPQVPPASCQGGLLR